MKDLIFVLIFVVMFHDASAQLRGGHLLGQVGLQSGTQGPPGINLLVLPAYLYSTHEFIGQDGHTIADDFSLNSFAAAPGMAWTLNTKIFGGNLGGSFFIPFVSNKIESHFSSDKSALAFSDIYIQPLQLGWHTKWADYMASFNLYLPSGKYKLNGNSNTGLGMWAYEFSAGSTVYFDKEKTWNFAALFSYEFNGKKKGTDIRVGDLLSIEGGLGKTFYKKTKGAYPLVINAGIAYYMQFKMTDDEITIPSSIIVSREKDRIFGLGPEGSIIIPSLRSMLGVRWILETGAVNRLQGKTFLVTWVYTIKSLESEASDK